MLDRSEIGKRGYLNEEYRLFHLRDSRALALDYHYHEFDKVVGPSSTSRFRAMSSWRTQVSARSRAAKPSPAWARSARSNMARYRSRSSPLGRQRGNPPLHSPVVVCSPLKPNNRLYAKRYYEIS